MSYLLGNPNHAPLGDIGTVATAVTKVVEDPCLGRVASLVLELHNIEAARTQPRTAVRTTAPRAPAPPTRGIGLCQAVSPLELAIKLRKRPWLVYASAGAVVGGLVLLGYGLGRMR